LAGIYGLLCVGFSDSIHHMKFLKCRSLLIAREYLNPLALEMDILIVAHHLLTFRRLTSTIVDVPNR